MKHNPKTSSQDRLAILVTGANGQLGLTIKEGYANRVDTMDFTFVTKEELDITNHEALEGYFEKHSFDYCINCAAYTNVEQAEKTPEMAIKVNAEGVKNLALICKRHKVILIHISTDYVFDGLKREPYTISDRPNPINAYGASKLLGEQYIQDYSSHYYIVRTSWLYSKVYGKNFYRFIVDSAEQGRSLNITTDQVGCPTDTVDLAGYIIEELIKQKPPYGLYHFCNSEPMTWYAFAKQILQENNYADKVILKPVDTYKTLAKRPKYSVLG
ncbi:dTDP-4-dehydrorhamnose reductase [Aestuariivivens sediminicola]|uniref:dTDP-4-dehydrorhamnose reductase n=1 Tax=Aestuariivivens sediminicola TaxID=2913560 RepID=UPI001F59B05A|nr:dTDP-4-dehydrorhamnose reductase [Aestuariivivens sediminicola]